MHIRRMNAGDITAVTAIEANSLSPWSREQIAAELTRPTGLTLVALSSSHELQGWCCGLHIGPEAELLKVGVARQWRRQGIGEALLLELCRLAAELGAETIFLEVRSQNSAAVQLYKKIGCRETGRRPDYYQQPADDAILFSHTLQGSLQREQEKNDEDNSRP